MNPFRDASPRPRCTKCRMRPSRCLCDRVQDTKREPPNLDKTPGQTRLDVGDHAGSRVSYWMRWMRTTGIREGLTVQPEQHQSSQDQRRAYHGVNGYSSGRSASERPKTVTDGKSAPARKIRGAEQPPRSVRGRGRDSSEMRRGRR